MAHNNNIQTRVQAEITRPDGEPLEDDAETEETLGNDALRAVMNRMMDTLMGSDASTVTITITASKTE